MKPRRHLWQDTTLAVGESPVYPVGTYPMHGQQCLRCGLVRRWNMVRWQYTANGAWESGEEPVCSTPTAPVEAT